MSPEGILPQVTDVSGTRGHFAVMFVAEEGILQSLTFVVQDGILQSDFLWHKRAFCSHRHTFCNQDILQSRTFVAQEGILQSPNFAQT